MMIFLAVAFYVILASARFIQEDKHQPEFYSLIMIATVGMMVVASSNDLITLFVGIELTSISSYALVAFRKRDAKGAEAAVKYFIIGGLSSGLALFGISLLYGVATRPSFAGIAQAVTMNSPMQSVMFLALVMIVAGFGFKVAIVPFHMWAPDVYEGAPTTVTAMLAGGSKKMGFIALFKVLLIGLFAIKSNWDVLIGIVAIATMTVGNLAAISQTNIKRMLAYSSIAQAGYILIAIPVGTEYALSAGIMQIMTHAFMKGGAFLIVATLATVAIGEIHQQLQGTGQAGSVHGLRDDRVVVLAGRNTATGRFLLEVRPVLIPDRRVDDPGKRVDDVAGSRRHHQLGHLPVLLRARREVHVCGRGRGRGPDREAEVADLHGRGGRHLRLHGDPDRCLAGPVLQRRTARGSGVLR